jgi:hypothetical protein
VAIERETGPIEQDQVATRSAVGTVSSSPGPIAYASTTILRPVAT